MPLTPQYTWEDKPDACTITVTLPQECSIKDVDVDVTTAAVKLNCPPALLLIDLFADIDDDAVHVGKDAPSRTVTIRCPKQRGVAWPKLVAQGTKDELKARRLAASQIADEKFQAKRAAAKERKVKEDDLVFRKQWDIEKSERQTIEDLKAHEAAVAAQEIEAFSKKVDDPKKKVSGIIGRATVEDVDSDEDSDVEDDEVEEVPAAEPSMAVDEDSAQLYRELRAGGGKSSKKERDVWASVPAPRQPAKVELTFTHKPTNLPARERIEEDDEEDTAQGGVGTQNANWLKDKGDNFYRDRNWAAAINAYTSALALDPKLSSCRSNRAAAYLMLKRYSLAVVDTTKVIEQLEKKIESNKEVEDISAQHGMCRAYARRSAAHLRLGMFKEGLRDLERASVFAPGDKAMAADVESVATLISTSSYVLHKLQGDEKFASEDFDGAIDSYNLAIKGDDACFQAYSNRAAAHLAKEDYAACVDDCDKALTLIDRDHDGGDTKLALRPLTRRATAHCWLGQYENGREDMKRALKLDPANNHLRQDLSLLVQQAPDGEMNGMKDIITQGMPM